MWQSDGKCCELINTNCLLIKCIHNPTITQIKNYKQMRQAQREKDGETIRGSQRERERVKERREGEKPFQQIEQLDELVA